MRIQQRLADAWSGFGGGFTRLDNDMATVVSYLQESNQELERAIEDLREGWVQLKEGGADTNRQKMRDRSRFAFQRGDTYIKGALRLTGEFCFEQGIDGPVSSDDRTEVQEALDAFWHDPTNQSTLFSTVAQLRASNQLLVDGDYFTILRTGTESDSRTAVRHMPAVQVVDMITDPLDLTRVLYFKCSVPILEWDKDKLRWHEDHKFKTIFYRDIFNTEEANDPLKDLLGGRAEPDAYLHHTVINAIDAADFGWPEPAVSLPWFDRHKRGAQDQEAISKMTAANMSRLKVSGTASDINAVANQIRARGQRKDGEFNENVAGQTTITNDQVEVEINRASSRAGEAETNSRMFRMAGGVGLGIPMHYSNDPENANLATARSMDRPTLVHLRAYQSIWIDTYRKLIDFHLKQHGIEDAKYDIPAPRIARQDISEAGKLIVDAYDRGLLTANQAVASVLDLLGFDDIANEIEIREDEMDAEDEAETTPLEDEVIGESGW